MGHWKEWKNVMTETQIMVTVAVQLVEMSPGVVFAGMEILILVKVVMMEILLVVMDAVQFARLRVRTIPGGK